MAIAFQEEPPINEAALAPVLETAEIARLAVPAAEFAPIEQRSHAGKRFIAAVTATLAIGGLAACGNETVSGEPHRTGPVVTSSANPSSSESAPTTEPSTSPSPTDTLLPGGSTSPTPEDTSGGDGSQIDTTTEEGLAKARPIKIEVDNSLAPFGTRDIIKSLYLDIQLADQTGDLDFLDAALGEDPTTELYTSLSDTVHQFQAYWATNRSAKLGYIYQPTEVQQEELNSLTWNLVVEEDNGTGIAKYQQNITLGKYANGDGTERWIIASINSSSKIN